MFIFKKYFKLFFPLSFYNYVLKFRILVKHFLIIYPKLRKQLNPKKIEFSDEKSINDERILFTLIETSHYQHLQLLILAKTLQIRGAKVKVLVCDGFLEGCEIKSVKNISDPNPCWSCKHHLKNVLPFFQLDTIKYEDLISSEKKIDINMLSKKLNLNEDLVFDDEIDLNRAIADSITRYYYGGAPLNIEEYNSIRTSHISTALLSLAACEKLIEWNPTRIISNMSVYSAWDPIKQFFDLKKIPFFLISITQFNFNALQINWPDLYSSSSRFEKWKNNRINKYLSNNESKVLKKFLNKRYKGESDIFKSLSFFDSELDIDKLLNINKEKKNIFLFSNIFWDVGLSNSFSVFNGVVDWVLSTIAIVKKYPHIQLYIKPHPGEVFDSSKSLKGVVDYIYDKYPILPQNVTILQPELKINTYNLIPHIDCGLVYNGTFGLELLLNDKPVIVCADAPYSSLPGVNFPLDIYQYEEAILNHTNKKINNSEINLFAYFYFIKTPIPWNLTNKAYGDDFSGFNLDSLNDLKEYNNIYLDHLVNSIINSEKTIIENW